MEFTYKHRKAAALFTLISVVLVLLLALDFTVFGVSYCEGSFEENILMTADNIGHCLSSPETYPLDTHMRAELAQILLFDITFTYYAGRYGLFFITMAAILLSTAGFSPSHMDFTPVSLRTRMDQ